MFNYLYTNDMRISELPSSIKRVSEILLSGQDLYQVDKSFGNNGATIQFYFNLQLGTETLSMGQSDVLSCIRNFVLKFQFPNTRTSESLKNCISDGIYFAPFRAIVSTLVFMSKNEHRSYLTHDEILYFFFCNQDVCRAPNFSVDYLVDQILSFRNNPHDLKGEIFRLLSWKQYERQLREMMTILQYSATCFKNTNGRVTYSGTPTEDEQSFIESLLTYKSIWFPTNPENYSLSSKEYTSYMDTNTTPFQIIEFNNNPKKKNLYVEDLTNQPLQQIFYGAPGTGKSHEIQERTKGCDVIRTTFHPDSDYASFVGAYKPTMEHLPLTDEQGQIIKVANTALYKDQITYSFVKQAFLQAYLCAWKKYTEPTQIANINYKQIFIDRCVELSSSTFPIEARQKQGGTTTIIGIDSNNVIYHNNAQNNGSSKIDSDINLTMPILPLAEAYSSIQGNINLLTSEKLREITKLPDITCGWAIINWVASQISRDQLLPKMSNATSPVYLIIEEINRGNCAQIFGDLFQLLDRQDNGFSTYPIQADGDMQKAIQKAFAQETDYKLNATLNVDGVVENYKSFSGKTLSEDIVNGDILLLPSNLYIWATMNTSDQSLFPIDSAFKRRWEWKYTRIAQGKTEDGTLEHWKLENDTDWWDFLKKINAIIDDMTQSADKQLGYYFCKPDKENDTISYARFVNKVLFYLWNDIFKTFSTDEYEQLFKIKRLKTDADGKWIEPHELEDKESKLTFPELYDEKGDVIPEIAKQFIEKVIAWGGKTAAENA